MPPAPELAVAAITAPPHCDRASPEPGAQSRTDSSRPDLARADVPRADIVGAALLESRQRWRDFVTLSADFAFETDAQGRFAFVAPDPALGWPATLLLGQPAALLLADAAGLTGFDPFRPTARTRGRRAWLRRPDGSPICLSFSAAPMLDEQGQIIGARGVGQDITDQDLHEAHMAATLRA